jgi:hypothetical protein
MKLPAWFPHPLAWLSAGLLLLFSLGWSAATAVAIQLLVDLARHSPRLAMLGLLGLWVSPVVLVAIAHRALHGVIDAMDTERLTRSGATKLESWWAGLFAWLVMFFTTTVATLILLALDPPPPPEPEALVRAVIAGIQRGAPASLHAAIWVAVAAGLYHFERLVRRGERGA